MRLLNERSSKQKPSKTTDRWKEAAPADIRTDLAINTHNPLKNHLSTIKKTDIPHPDRLNNLLQIIFDNKKILLNL